MSFARPWMLLLLAVPVLLAYWEWNREGLRLTLPFDHGSPARRDWLRRLITSAHVLPALLLAVAIAVLAGPRRQGPPGAARVMTNIQFLLDVSGSMTSPFGDGSQYDAAMNAINQFVSYRKGDAYGLTIFGNEVLHWVPLTKDTSAISLATPFLRPEKQPYWMGGTQIGKALRSSRKLLAAREEGDRMIILVSDGMSSDLGGTEAQDIAQELKEERIVVYMIAVAMSSPPSEMFTIASATGGDVFTAGDPAALDTVFRHIDRMQKTKLKERVTAPVDWFRPFAAGGLGLAALQLLTLFGLRFTPW